MTSVWRFARFLVPLAVFVLIVWFLWRGLSLKPREVPSPLIDKPAPVFALPLLREPGVTLATGDLAGKVWMFNVFASWCTPCLEEHPLLVRLAQRQVVPIYGLNYKDRSDAALEWLGRHGDPYTSVLVDGDGRIGIEYGVYGVPETFIVDKAGVIRFKHIGPLTPKVLEQEVEPLIRSLQQ